MKEAVKAKSAPEAIGPYSQAVVSGNLVFTAGQIHLRADGELLEGSIEDKTHQIMKNLKLVLEATGCSFDNVVKSTIYLKDMADFKAVNEVYGSYLSEPFPARETVAVKDLPKGASLEISMVAIKS